MALILDGKVVAQTIKDEIFHTYDSEDIKLTIFQVGDNPASNTYVRNKRRACDEAGIESEVVKMVNADCEAEKRLWKLIHSCTGQFVVIGDDGNVTTRSIIIAEEVAY